jgi:dihydrofolate reductase
MRKIIYAMSVSLDGFIEDSNGDINWSAPDEELHQHFNDIEGAIGVHLYGRRMYEIMSAYWPTADQQPSALKVEIEYAWLWRRMPKVVFSTTLEKVGWNSRLVKGNIADEVNRLKSQPGSDMSVGGAGLAASFMHLGLIDEYRLYIHPILLGSGKPMFPRMKEEIRLKLVETRQFSSSVVLVRYLT